MALCTLGVHVSPGSVLALASCHSKKAPKVKAESLKDKRLQKHWARGQSCPGDKVAGSQALPPGLDQQSRGQDFLLSSLRCCTPSFPVLNSNFPLAQVINLHVGCLCSQS